MTKFEVRLSPEDATEVLLDMRRTGAVSKAEYVRACLIAGRAGRADLLAEEIGLLGLAINAVALKMGDAETDIGHEIRPILAAARSALRRINRILNRELR